MTINLLYLLILFIFLNVRSFWMMGQDKKTAIKNNSTTGAGRIPEKKLLLTAILFGFLGIGLGMQFFRHKINKPRFKYGVPFIILLHFIAYFYIWNYLDRSSNFNLVYDDYLFQKVKYFFSN